MTKPTHVKQSIKPRPEVPPNTNPIEIKGGLPLPTYQHIKWMAVALLLTALIAPGVVFLSKFF